MKQGHFVLLFLMLYMTCFLLLRAEESRYDKVMEEKQKVENALLEAIENTAREFSAVIYDSDEKKKQVIENIFFESLYAALGIFEEKEEQERIKMYFPILILVEEDGAMFFYMQENSKNGYTELQHVWSEKKRISFPENSEDSVKKQRVIEVLEAEASKYITNHNYIAAQYGIAYSFSVPTFLCDSLNQLDFPILFAVFQGWPLTASGDVLYENCIDAAVYLQELERFILEIPADIISVRCIYHRESCVECLKESNFFLQKKLTAYEAVCKYGAYPCEICVP